MAGDFPAEATTAVQRHIEDEHGYLPWLNTRVDAIGRGRIVMTIPYDGKLANTVSPPTIHGGIAVTLIGTAGDTALRAMLDDPLTGGVATINLNVSYLRQTSGDLTVIAEVVCAGGSVDISTIAVVSTDPEENSGVAARQSPSSGWSDAVAAGQGAY